MLSFKETEALFCLAPKAVEKASWSPKDKDINFDDSGIVICAEAPENDEHEMDYLAMESSKVAATLGNHLWDRDLFRFVSLRCLSTSMVGSLPNISCPLFLAQDLCLL